MRPAPIAVSALADGSFRQAGLDVHVQVPSDPSLPLKLLAAGKIDLAVSYEPEVLLARNQGPPGQRPGLACRVSPAGRHGAPPTLR